MPTAAPRLLFEDREIRVLHLPGTSDYSLVTFSDLNFQGGATGFWAEKPAARLGLDAIGIVARRQNWFPVASVAAAAPAIRAVLKPRSLSYGYSMGGYGALKHAARLGVTAALAVCPQVSISPADVPWDRRFHDRFRPRLHRGMQITPADLPGFAAILADPFDAVDWRHAGMIGQMPAVRLIPTPLMGHAALWLLLGTEALAEVLPVTLAGDGATLAAILRSRRGRSVHWCRLIGRVAFAHGHARAAAALWDRAASLGATPAVLAAERGQAKVARIARLLRLGRGEEAEAATARLIADAPRAASLIGQAGHHLLAAGRPVMAEAAFRQALAGRPAAAEFHLGLSLALAAQGRIAEAIAAARAGHAANPRDVALGAHLGHLLNGAGAAHRAEAERVFRAVLAIAPGDGRALYGLSTILAGRRQLPEALRLAQRAAARLPLEMEVQLWHARLCLRSGAPAQAEPLFRRCVAEAAAPPEAWLGLAEALAALGRREEAAEACRSGLSRHPADERLARKLRALTGPARIAERLRRFFGMGQ